MMTREQQPKPDLQQLANPDILVPPERPLAGKTVVITGTSRGVGASAAVTYAEAGADRVIGTHINPGRKRKDMQDAVLEECRAINPNGHFEAVLGDITDPQHQRNLLATTVGGDLSQPTHQIGAVVLNAAGGLEIGKPPEYAREINVLANLQLVDLYSDYMARDSIFIYTQSLWGHLYGRIDQEPRYEPIARSKHEAEVELIKRMEELSKDGIRVGILVGDVIKGTDMYKLLERFDKERLVREEALVPGGKYPNAVDIAQRMVTMTQNVGETGIIEYVGRTGDEYLDQFNKGLIPRSTS